jgi:CHAT domain-containing protein
MKPPSLSSIFSLEVVMQKEHIMVSLAESNSTVHQYQEMSIDYREIQALCQQVIKLLNKANELGQLAADVAGELKKVGKLFYDQLLPQSVKRRLKETKFDHLIIVMDEKLASVPWELLYDGEQFFCLRFNLGRKMKTQQPINMYTSRPMSGPIKMLILADPKGDLEFSRKEAEVIRESVQQQPGRRQKGFAVSTKITNISKAYVKKNISDYDMVHYAGHTDFQEQDPARGGWLLSDGLLTAQDIAQMQGVNPLPSLIFSNSCQSAHEHQIQINPYCEHQLFGLANAFLLGGVRHFIGMLWEVPDQLGLVFAREFYRQIVLKRPIGLALKEARRAFIKEYGEDHILWAGYILYGDPTVLIPLVKEKPVASHQKKSRLLWGMIGIVLLISLIFLYPFVRKYYQAYLYRQYQSSAQTLVAAGRYKEAVVGNQKAFTLTKDMSDQRYAHEAAVVLGERYQQQAVHLLLFPGESADSSEAVHEALSKAMECYQRIFQRATEVEGYLLKVRALKGIANLHQLNGDLKKAMRIYETIPPIMEDKRDLDPWGRVLLAATYIDLADLSVRAELDFDRASFYIGRLEGFKGIEREHTIFLKRKFDCFLTHIVIMGYRNSQFYQQMLVEFQRVRYSEQDKPARQHL